MHFIPASRKLYIMQLEKKELILQTIFFLLVCSKMGMFSLQREIKCTLSPVSRKQYIVELGKINVFPVMNTVFFYRRSKNGIVCPAEYNVQLRKINVLPMWKTIFFYQGSKNGIVCIKIILATRQKFRKGIKSEQVRAIPN